MQTAKEVEVPESVKKRMTYYYKRRVHDIHASCKILGGCQAGCPFFVRAGGNFYCVRGDLP
jgi:hypothetical protein